MLQHTIAIEHFKTAAKSRARNDLPRIGKVGLKLLPFALQKKALMPLLHKLTREQIEDGALDFLDGRVLEIQVTDLNLKRYFSKQGDELVMFETSQTSDVCFAGSSQSFLSVALQEADADTLFFSRKLVISGDTELGLELKNCIDQFDLNELPSALNKIFRTLHRLLQD